MSTAINKPDLKLRAKVANVDGWLGVIEKAGRVWGTHPIHGNWAEVPHYEQDYNAIIPAIQRWCKRMDESGERQAALAYMFFVYLHELHGPCAPGMGPIHPHLSSPPCQLSEALEKADNTVKRGGK